ncbi:peptidase S16 lon domain protein [Prosthecochloris aestuarii DSM 271]|uniref:endopeptidase La n=1 Tax=Prosthecochloris aestuarii (strain DSM 271 / SK 413) TaxID=290512 RepID=B4S4N6_PROA2|nr:ATP-binding protein [Prosthecochloris aestuarii]ACF46932.1 peptidase S16 lon domain protein [Prosthecochloris aestuarii DSM 271]
MSLPAPLNADTLYKHCDAEQFSFSTTEELEDKPQSAGQERAIEAIRFSIGMKHDGFNLFALGPGGTGKQTAIELYLKTTAPAEKVPDDWCYVYNFLKPRQPAAISMPPGKACALSKDMDLLIEELITSIPAAFNSEEYQEQEKAIKEEFQDKESSAIEALEKKAADNNIAVIRTPSGFAFAPIRKGEVLKSEEFLRLKPDEKEDIEREIAVLKESMQSIMMQIPKWQREGQEKLKELNQQVAGLAIRPVISELKTKYREIAAIATYLEAAEKDIIDNFEQFLAREDQMQEILPVPAAIKGSRKKQFHRYRVNVIVDNGDTNGAPVVYEDKPSCQNLLGDIEHISQMGTLVTDFTLIKSGALHKANGGYLILDARRLLLEPLAYEALKKAIRTRQIRIESLAQLYSLISTVSLEPEPLALDIKVILLGERHLYYLLSAYDPDFRELFKVAADFDDTMERSEPAANSYANILAGIVRKGNLRHLDRHAVARVIEYGARISGDANRLSTHLQSLADLVHEADFFAGEDNSAHIGRNHIQKAIDAKRYRAGRIPERIRTSMMEKTILIDTDSEKTGQINGLAVYLLGDQSFGHPSRITAQIRMGKGEVIDIEREVEMGGPIHSKGVLILTGFLGGRFGVDQPLSLSATLVFEQSYSGIEGDSASSAELYALLSALSDIPIRQWLAVTGSVNQHGEVQAIGGVNEKIEGFFDLCNARGLSGKEGVLIPASNTRHLMLREDVVEAVRDNRFHIYPVTHIDEGIEILTGKSAGKADENNVWQEGSINARIVARLKEIAEKQKAFSALSQKHSNNE